ncbi:hypothetical protein RN001_002961 [Aquatica leii]|uniref:Uncharacterized protein n=1 Tax=Aquatica leii TaxID=1421715 RepID=A0AAN7PE96_9COLE|nr:hypothetical protein RN001_002961 [Aquatica leii]
MHVRVIQLFGFIFIVITPIFSEKQKNQKTEITADRRYQNSLIDTFDENLGFFGLFGYDLRDYDNSFVPAGLKHKPTGYNTYTGINTLAAINEAVPLVKSYTVPVQFKQPFGISVTARVPVVPFSFRRPVTNIRRPIQVPGIYPLRKEVHSLVPYSLTSKNIPAYNYLLTTKPRMLPHADAEFAKFNFAPIINQGASTGNYIILSGNNKLSDFLGLTPWVLVQKYLILSAAVLFLVWALLSLVLIVALIKKNHRLIWTWIILALICFPCIIFGLLGSGIYLVTQNALEVGIPAIVLSLLILVPAIHAILITYIYIHWSKKKKSKKIKLEN